MVKNKDNTQKKKTKNSENLIPLNKLAKEAQRKIQSKGGLACAEKKREQKKISEMYAEFLANKYVIEYEDGKKTLTGEQLVNDTIKRVFLKADAPSVSMLKEIREATEGSKVKIEGGIIVSITPLDEAL